MSTIQSFISFFNFHGVDNSFLIFCGKENVLVVACAWIYTFAFEFPPVYIKQYTIYNNILYFILILYNYFFFYIY